MAWSYPCRWLNIQLSEEIGSDDEEIPDSTDKKTRDAEVDHADEEIKDLRRSKWSSDLDEDDVEGSDKAN